MKSESNTQVYNACAHCDSAPLCSPQGLTYQSAPEGLTHQEQMHLSLAMRERMHVPKGKALFRTEQACYTLYTVRSGSFKTQMKLNNGQPRVFAFYMQGELLGLDGLFKNKHPCTAIALEDSEVCVMPLNRLDEVFARMPNVHRHFMRIMSSEINHMQAINMDLALLDSEQRVAKFLLDMSDRLAKIGYSPKEFHLRMRRSDIGNYLGLTLETVSRTISQFNKAGLIKAHHRHIQIEQREDLLALLRRKR